MVVQGVELSAGQDCRGGGGVVAWLGVPSVSTVIKYSCLLCWSSREKSNVEQEIKEQEKSIRERTSEVQVQ